MFTQGGVVTTGALTASTDANDIADQLNTDTNFKVIHRVGRRERWTGRPVQDRPRRCDHRGWRPQRCRHQRRGRRERRWLHSTDLGVEGVDLTTQAGASAAIAKIDDAIKLVSTARANLGALQNRFEHTINNLYVTEENLSASESRIRDTDMASEMVQFTRSQILSQAGTAMLAQANQIPQGVLSLLRG